jgi:peptidyl-prolyl cis-trans isomerase A (cyclophilin A)
LNKELVMTRWILPSLCVVALAAAGCGAPEPAPAPESQPPAASEPPSTPPPSTEKPAAEADKPAAAPETPAPPAEKPPAPPAAADSSKPSAAKHGPGVYAHLTTNHGTMIARLFDKEVPRTVENFVGLAEGKKQWRNPRTNSMVRRPYYNNLTFHRIIPGFMIQGGDPEGTGMGGPGYRFDDEFHPKLRHSKAGILSMANAGPNTNGGQFFITLGPTPHLDNRHSVFGEVVDGLDVVRRIGKVPTGRGDRPVNDVRIQSVTIERVE